MPNYSHSYNQLCLNDHKARIRGYQHEIMSCKEKLTNYLNELKDSANDWIDIDSPFYCGTLKSNIKWCIENLKHYKSLFNAEQNKIKELKRLIYETNRKKYCQT